MHDRGDYKAGWQIDADWEAKQKAEAAVAALREERLVVAVAKPEAAVEVLVDQEEEVEPADYSTYPHIHQSLETLQ